MLDVKNISMNFGYGALFKNLDISLNEGEKIAIVGPNGCGKSTILKIIAGFIKCDIGTVHIKKGTRVAYLDQGAPDKQEDRLVYDILKDAFFELLHIQKEMDVIVQRLENEREDKMRDKLLFQYGRLQETFEILDGYNMDTHIDMVSSGLKLSKEMQLQNYNDVSGGEKTLVHMAKSLLQKPDLLLLDEPTNHLDITRIEWLENYIKCFKGAVVMVSHDRAFLDKISNHILEIDDGEAIVYHTNYSGYVKQKNEQFEKRMADYKHQRESFHKIENQAKRFAEAGMATNSTAMTKKAVVMFHRLEREKAKYEIKKPVENKKIKIGFDGTHKSSKRAIELKDVAVRVGDRTIVHNINICISMGERIAMIGANGSGKSSIIKTMLDVQDLPTFGEIIISPSVKIGYIPQIITFENEKQTVFEYFRAQACLNEERSRSILARFLFHKNDIFKRIGRLSKGESIRLRLAILLQQQMNTLLFDEPTNHIDIPTKESLEEAIAHFEGTILAVSHDRFFINKFANKVIEIENGNAHIYFGNYDYYTQKKERNRG